MGLRMQPRKEKFFSRFSKAGSNVVESAAIRMEFVAAPHERWAENAKRLQDTERAGDDTTSVGEPDQAAAGTRPPLRLPHQRLDPSPRRLAQFC
jgi:uncharacterized protein Yka (UPF0111/DUF47 family)